MKLFCKITIKHGVKSKIARFKNRLLVLTILSFTSIYTLFLLMQWNIVCLNLEVKLQLNRLCKEFKEGHVFGDLCPALCSDQVSVISCHSMHKGKSTVFTALWNNSLVVIKNPKDKADYIPIEGTSYNSTVEFPSYEEFTKMIIQSIQLNLGITTDNLLPKLYPFIDFQNDITKKQMINLWELSQDYEYVTLMLNSHSVVFPKILGSCGTFYAMEYAKPVTSIDNLFSSSADNLHEQIRMAKLFIDLLDILEFSFPKALHMCDVKLEHFGILRGRAVLLDVDTVFPKQIIDRSVADGRTCAKHADCGFFDCRSLCSEVRHVCDTPVINNNLQLVCQKIFLDSELLVSKRLPSVIQGILHECAHQLSSNRRRAATVRTLKELRNFFDEFLKSTYL